MLKPFDSDDLRKRIQRALEMANEEDAEEEAEGEEPKEEEPKVEEGKESPESLADGEDSIPIL